MEADASILLGFPSLEPNTPDDFFDGAVKRHLSLLEDFFSKPPAGDKAVQLLKLIDPAVNSISYLFILDSLQAYEGFTGDDRSQAFINFFLSFDARQIRYVGSLFSDLLKRVTSPTFAIPHDVKTSLLANAILKIDPTGSMLTSRHFELALLAFDNDTADEAFPVLDKQVVYFPGMNKEPSTGSGRTLGSTPQKLLCDLSLPPTEYISRATGLTDELEVENVLEYEFLSGLLYMSRLKWDKALAAFERIVTHPTRDGGVSTFMTQAYNKWLLVSLIANGRTPEIPNYVSAIAKKAFETTSKPYMALGAHFDAMAAKALKKEVEDHTQEWVGHRNSGLVQKVLEAHQKWQIMDLRNVYTKISIADIRKNTCSAETGDALASDAEVETLIQGMIDSGMLKGVIEKPDDKPAYLTFLSEAEDLSEIAYQKEIASTVERLKDLEEIYRTTNNRLSTNPYWVKHIIREQKREKDNAGQGSGAGGHSTSFEDQIEDEDLMSGVMHGNA